MPAQTPVNLPRPPGYVPHQPMTRLQKKRAKLIASTALGPVLLIAGLIAKSAVSTTVSICASGFGQLAQGLDQAAAAKCSAASTVSDAGTWAIIFGLVFLAAGIIGLVSVNRERLAAGAAKPDGTPPAP